jgi:hypothetical protein
VRLEPLVPRSQFKAQIGAQLEFCIPAMEFGNPLDVSPGSELKLEAWILYKEGPYMVYMMIRLRCVVIAKDSDMGIGQ